MKPVAKRLRLIEPGYENFTGQVGMYTFVDGITEELVGMAERDRISAAMRCVEVDEDGAEQEAGFAARYLREVNVRADEQHAVNLARMTAEDKAKEDVRSVTEGETIKKLYSTPALHALVSAEGIVGLRLVAQDWDVRSKSINELIYMIERAQTDYIADRVQALVVKGVTKEAAELLFVLSDVPPLKNPPVEFEEDREEDPVVAPEKGKGGAKAEAAMSGDMSAALNAE